MTVLTSLIIRKEAQTHKFSGLSLGGSPVQCFIAEYFRVRPLHNLNLERN